MNKLVKAVMALLMCVSLLYIPVFALTGTSETKLSFNENYTITSEFNKLKMSSENLGEISSATLSIENIESSPIEATLTIKYNSEIESINMTGMVQEIVTDKYIGYVGTFKGLIDGNDQIPVFADVSYTSEDDGVIFVTIGAASLTSTPQVTVFGNLSESVSAISTAYANSVSDKNQEVDNSNSLQSATSVNNQVIYRGCANFYSSGYSLGGVGMFSALEAENGDLTTVYGKINSNTTNARLYLVNVGGYVDSRIDFIRVSGATIKLASSKNIFHTDGVYAPAESSSSINIPVPTWTPSYGLQFLSFNYLLNSVSISEGYLTGAHSPNNVTWDLYNSYGWSTSSTDGVPTSSSSTSPGISVRTAYQYEGNLTSNTSVALMATGSIDYAFQYQLENGSYVLHFSTNTTSTSSYSTTILA